MLNQVYKVKRGVCLTGYDAVRPSVESGIQTQVGAITRKGLGVKRAAQGGFA
jgi:hypothetical protein